MSLPLQWGEPPLLYKHNNSFSIILAFLSTCGLNGHRVVRADLTWKMFLQAKRVIWLTLQDIFSSLLGYFVQDAGDIILTGHARGSWEFLLHHALVRRLWQCFHFNSIRVTFLVQIRYRSHFAKLSNSSKRRGRKCYSELNSFLKHNNVANLVM